MKDKSLEEIDILKLLIWSLSFVSVCVALILFLLLPVLKSYKQENIKENAQIALLKNEDLKLNLSKDKITNLQTENNKSLEQFKQNFNVKNFNAFLQKYFKNVKIEKIDIKESKKYLKEKIKISVSMPNPKNLYNFLDDLKGYDNLMRLNYPLLLEASKEGIETSFILEIYSS